MIVENSAAIGALIRATRKAQGLTQDELAALAGVGTRFLSELERGKDTAEIGLVLRVLTNLGVDVHLEHRTR